jgi:hypothetical protein
MCLYRAGRREEAREMIDSLEGQLRTGNFTNAHQYSDLAAYYAWTGDVDRSLVWFQRSVEVTPVIAYWQIDSGLFDRVRQNPKFVQGLARLGAEARTRAAAASPR